ncbi:hypothetical protein F4804DRAFT_325750 [Jackrogersella minutella]|nr:hypothetical protein F4804DRAFT_325750 [Jackrogersella minutella]
MKLPPARWFLSLRFILTLGPLNTPLIVRFTAQQLVRLGFPMRTFRYPRDSRFAQNRINNAIELGLAIRIQTIHGVVGLIWGQYRRQGKAKEHRVRRWKRGWNEHY